jgi:hypothetical protein
VDQRITELTCFLDPLLCQRFAFPLTFAADHTAGQGQV